MISTLKKKLNKKGFTLAELLIVVAIIAVLAAIAIPVFGAQLNKAKHNANVANVRAAYAEVLSTAMINDTDASGSVKLAMKAALDAVELTTDCTVTCTPATKDGSGNVTAQGKITVLTAAGNSTDLPIDSDVTFYVDGIGTDPAVGTYPYPHS